MAAITKYVDASLPSSGDGTSWATAYKSIADVWTTMNAPNDYTVYFRGGTDASGGGASFDEAAMPNAISVTLIGDWDGVNIFNPTCYRYRGPSNNTWQYSMILAGNNNVNFTFKKFVVECYAAKPWANAQGVVKIYSAAARTSTVRIDGCAFIARGTENTSPGAGSALTIQGHVRAKVTNSIFRVIRNSTLSSSSCVYIPYTIGSVINIANCVTDATNDSNAAIATHGLSSASATQNDTGLRADNCISVRRASGANDYIYINTLNNCAGSGTNFNCPNTANPVNIASESTRLGLFKDPNAGDYSAFEPNAPNAYLTNKGINSGSVTGVTTDIFGNDRNAAAAGAAWDIGLYEWGFGAPYPGVHDVTDVSQAGDPECIYYGQTPAIVVGNQVSYKETTETNGWPVNIDAQGFPIIDAGGATGTDSFKFNVGRSGVWDPVPPASNTWTFTIESEVPAGPPILYTANSGSPIRGGQLSVPYTGSNLGSDISTRKLHLAQGAVEVEQTQVTGSDLAGTFNVIGFAAGGKLQYGQAQLKATRPSVVTPPATLPTFAQRTHTVSATATGAGTGTDAAPWTLKQAMEQCQPGMIIGVKAGVYVGTKGMGYALEDEEYRACAWHPRNTGTAVSRIVFVAEHLAALTTDTTKYSDLRSGATVVGYGWPAFGCIGHGTRPVANYIDFIGFYSSEDAPNNKLWGGGDGLTLASAAGDATISGAWGRGNNSRFLYCRLVRNDDIENAGRPFDNKSHFRFEDVNGVEVADCHLFIRSCTQGVNNTCFTLYGCQNIDAHHNYCYTDAGQGYCWHPKLGFEQKNSPFSGLRFHHNRVENFFFMTRQSGQRDEGTEASCTHVYSNLFINGRAPFTWVTTDGKWTFDGARYYNNTFVNMQKGGTNGEASGFELEGTHQAVPALNPRNIQYFNNIVYNAANYMMTNYSTKTPPGLDYISDFVEANRNCIWGLTNKLFRGSGGAGDTAIDNATFAQWQATNWNGRASDDNSIVADPLFAETTNYTLSAGSPCLTLGRDLHGTYGPTNATIPAGCYVLPGDIIGIRP